MKSCGDWDSFMQSVAIDSRMSHISGFDRCQLSLLPEAIDDYVGSDNPVRFIDAFVGRARPGSGGVLTWRRASNC
jgi:hypothetical protein